ncbi:MAG: glycosyltransferase [Deltaproteobacteria bacterium]|jgi:spore maturation protein CgeB|nr:glycosyltransferase [Deltaproteobacteria bacterium]
MTPRYRDFWCKNLALLEKKDPLLALDLANSYTIDSDGSLLFGTKAPLVSLSFKPHPVLELKGKTPVRLTSIYPQKEDENLVKNFLAQGQSDLKDGISAIGLGLGYHLESLLEPLKGAPLWVFEANKELVGAFLAAKDQSALLGYPSFKIHLGPIFTLPQDAPQRILCRPAHLHHFPSSFPKDLEKGKKLEKGLSSPFRKQKALPKVLFFKSGYYLDKEIRGALKRLGTPLALWDIADWQDSKKNWDKSYRELLSTIKDFKPDLILTVNHLGFDEDGVLSDILSRLGLPCASWFVDSPWYILKNTSQRPYHGLSAFSWDQDYLAPLKDLGFERAYFLPLAADETFFHIKPKGAIKYAITFVGDSMNAATDKYLALSGYLRKNLDKLDILAGLFLKTKELLPDPLYLGENGLGAQLGIELPSSPRELLHLSALITWRASRAWRLSILKALPAQYLTIAGDQIAWKKLVPEARTLGNLDYYTELSSFYRSSKVNINITSAQMKTGLNQRVFDVPASGAFLLTDERAQAFSLFANDELPYYRDPEEARDLALFYLSNDSLRQKITEKARETILKKHLYIHRLPKLLELTLAG